MSVLKTSKKERNRLEVFARVKRGEVSLRVAADLVGLSYRQTLRSYDRFKKQGAAGVVHQLRGRASNRKLDPKIRRRALALYQKKYSDFGPTLAAESLAADDGLEVPLSVLRRWLLQAGLWKARPRGSQHRKWRERRACFGEMVQVDGSLHDWFEGRRGKASLIVMIDDATNWMYARFFAEETTAAVMETFRRYVAEHGLPRSLYTDRDSIYETTRDATTDENLREKTPLTQFGRAMKDLDVTLILAHSPQAKGRVERRHGVLQDRLVKALRQRKISTLEEANTFLEESFLGPFNERFQVPAKNPADLHRAVPRSTQLEHVLSYQDTRVVQNDWTISWRNRFLQLTEANRRLAVVKKSVLVCEHLDGSIHLWFRKRELTWVELTKRPPKPKKPAPAKKAGGAPHKPAPGHPWRRPINATKPEP